MEYVDEYRTYLATLGDVYEMIDPTEPVMRPDREYRIK